MINILIKTRMQKFKKGERVRCICNDNLAITLKGTSILDINKVYTIESSRSYSAHIKIDNVNYTFFGWRFQRLPIPNILNINVKIL
jgi:hypothetical protein